MANYLNIIFVMTKFVLLVSIAITTDISLTIFPLGQMLQFFGLVLICLIGVAVCVYFIDGKEKLLLVITSFLIKFKFPSTCANTHRTPQKQFLKLFC